MSSVQEIVVIGRIQREGESTANVSYTSVPYSSNVGADWADRYQSWADNTDYASASVHVDVSTSSSLSAATTAAQNIARALAKIEAELQSLDPSTVINWDGNSMTAGEILTTLNSTKFVVTDNPNFNNAGVGSADGDTNTVTLYYGAYDGIGTNDYASPNYQNDAGLVGILLHDIGHMTPAGEEWHDMSLYYYKEEFGTESGYYDSSNVLAFAYARNDEKFANDFAYATGAAFGADTLTGVNLAYGTGAIDPLTIYNGHIGN